MLLSFCADTWFCIAWKADLVPSINSLYSVHIEYLPWMKKRGHPFKIFTHFCGEKKKLGHDVLCFYFVLQVRMRFWFIQTFVEIQNILHCFHSTNLLFFSSFEKPEKFIEYKKNADIKKKWREERIKRIVCAWAKWLLPPFPSGSLFQFPQHELTRSVITLLWIGCQSIKRLLPPPNSPEFHQVFMTIFLYQLTVGSKKLIGIKA